MRKCLPSTFRSFLALAPIVTPACGGPTQSPSASTEISVTSSTAPTPGEAAVADTRTDCEIVLQDLELGPKSAKAIELLNQPPDGPKSRDAMLAGVDRYAARWKESASRVRDARLRGLGDAYVAGMMEHRKVIAGLQLKYIPPAEPPAPAPTTGPGGKPLTKEELARQAAMREAADFGMMGMLKGDFWVLEEPSKKAFEESRGHFLDAWQPLLSGCEK